MTPYQKLLIEQSEHREKVNAVLAVETEKRTDEQKDELLKSADRLKAIEPDLRAAIVADEAGKAKLATEFAEDAEGAELRQLIAGASIGDVFSAAVEHRATEGRTAELQTHYKVQPNQIPLALLRQPVEKRAVTPAPTNVGTNQAEITPGVFPMSAAEFLGIDMPTVGVGDAVYPVLTKNAAVEALAENDRAPRRMELLALTFSPRPACKRASSTAERTAPASLGWIRPFVKTLAMPWPTSWTMKS